jgi:hypothetical protein
MGTKEAGARGHEEDEAGAGWCCSDWAGERITGTGRRGGQGSGGSGTGDTAIRRAVGVVRHASREIVRRREGLTDGA